MVWGVQECGGTVEDASGTDIWPLYPPTAIGQAAHGPAIYPLKTTVEINSLYVKEPFRLLARATNRQLSIEPRPCKSTIPRAGVGSVYFQPSAADEQYPRRKSCEQISAKV